MKDAIGDKYPFEDIELPKKAKQPPPPQPVPQPQKKEPDEPKSNKFSLDDYLRYSSELSTLFEKDREHLRKLIATMTPQAPQDVFDLIDKVTSAAKQLNETLPKKESEGGILDIVRGITELMKGIDPSTIGNVLKSIGDALSKSKKE